MEVVRKTRNFVPAIAESRERQLPARRIDAQALQHLEASINVPLGASQTLHVETNSVDRARGFLIASLPRTFAFSLAVAIVAIVAAGVSALVALTVLFATFAAAELLSYAVTLLMSAEGVSLYEARRKWNVIEREQENRWRYYDGGEK